MADPTGNTVAGILKEIRYHQDGFLIARLDTGVTVKGRMLWPEVGLEYEFEGRWERHPRFGDGFRFEDYRARHPTSVVAIQEYLVENADGIGPRLAEKLTDAFGERTLEVLKADPKAVADKVPGIKIERAEAVSRQITVMEDREALFLALKDMMSGTRIPKSAIQDVIKLWGEEAPEVIRANPYQLIDAVDHVGFAIADAIARKIGYDPEGYPRIRAGSIYALRQAASESGHVFLPKRQFTRSVSELLTISEDKVLAAIPEMRRERFLVLRGDSAYFAPLYNDETGVAAKIRTLLSKL